MAGENCNLNKDEAEILKPSSSSSPTHSSPTPSLPPATPPPSLLLKPPPLEFPAPERPGRLDQPPAASAVVDAASSCPPKTEEESQEIQKPEEESHEPAAVRFSNRCSSCGKKVGLTGFRCRCGDLYCGRHRYSDSHDCSFDYKAAGREQISKANPLIRAAKIIKI